jgi:uncharacterized protein DUF3108
MKKILFLTLALLFAGRLCIAQGCDQFINAVNGKKLIYNNLDPKGNSQSTISYTSTKKDATTVLVHSQMTDKRGQSSSGDSEITCTGNSFNVDMKSFIPPASSKQFSNMQIQADGKYLAYPIDLKAGQQLPDGIATMEITNNGSHFADVNINITNRKVEGQETITTGAGSFDCYIISYDSSVKIKIIGIGIPANIHGKEWFSTKLGRPVKTESYNKGGKLMGTMQLDAIN